VSCLRGTDGLLAVAGGQSSEISGTRCAHRKRQGVGGPARPWAANVSRFSLSWALWDMNGRSQLISSSVVIFTSLASRRRPCSVVIAASNERRGGSAPRVLHRESNDLTHRCVATCGVRKKASGTALCPCRGRPANVPSQARLAAG
jgi:hypothetical protein